MSKRFAAGRGCRASEARRTAAQLAARRADRGDRKQWNRPGYDARHRRRTPVAEIPASRMAGVQPELVRPEMIVPRGPCLERAVGSVEREGHAIR
jgi:hypothetical protein